MRRGVVLPHKEISGTAHGELAGFCAALEDAGFDHLLIYDHVLGADTASRPGWKGVYTSADPFLEPLMTFAHLASATSLDFMTGVLVLPQRQTALVAKQIATLEAIAPGRLRVGVGIGWNDVEYEALGKDFGNRGKRLDEQIVLLRRLLSEPVVDYHGTWERVDRAGILPLPPRPVPIWIGSGDSPAGLRRVGQLADGWLPTPAIAPGRGFEEAWDRVRGHADQAGRAAGSIAVEGHVRMRERRGIDGLRKHVDGWRAAGAMAVTVDVMGMGAEWPKGHAELVRAASAAFGG
jgi:probable F420-dependent oxidoreductase